MRAARGALLAGLLLLAPRPLVAWGFEAHRLIADRAVDTLPAELRPFFQQNRAFVREHSVDPDLQRSGPDDPAHFLDIDAFGDYPFEAVPLDESEHLARHGAEAVKKGRVPWRVAEVYAEMKDAFVRKDLRRALDRAAHLAHYVSDAHVPLHGASNHDGQETGQRGIHGRWESELVDRFHEQIRRAALPAAARPLGDPAAAMLAVIRESWVLSREVLAADKALAGTVDLADTTEDERYDDRYYSRLWAREGDRLVARLAASATVTASLWLQAWQEAGAPALPAAAQHPYVRGARRGVVVTIDGAPAWLVADAMRRGVMPRLAALAARGTAAEGVTPALPVKTAVNHASLYTGAWSDRTGVTGNELVPPGASLLESTSGFTSTNLKAEPLWVTAARQGLSATVLFVPQVFPFRPYLEERRFGGSYGSRLTLVDGYQNAHLEPAVFTAAELGLREPGTWSGVLPAAAGPMRELTLHLAGTEVNGLLFDDPADPVAGFDTLLLAVARDASASVLLKPVPPRGDASAFAALPLRMAGGDAAVYFRLHELSPDGATLRLAHAGASVLRSSRPRVEAPLLAATGGLVRDGSAVPYEKGLFGTTLDEGGDGTAERRYLEAIHLAVRQTRRIVDFAMARTRWDLLVAYLPYPDEALHRWLGVLDPGLKGHDPVLAGRLRPFVDEMLGAVDAFVGHLVDGAGPEAVVVVTADHGQIATNRVARPNVALAQAGLLATDAEGRIDLGRTQALYPRTNAGYLAVNRAEREGGIVAPEAVPGVIEKAAAALRAARDPEGRPVFTAVFDAARHEPRAGGPAGGDLYLTAAPDVEISPETRGEVVSRTSPRGTHQTAPERPALRAPLVLAGPGVAQGRIGVVRVIDVAPTLAALLGLEKPAQAEGAVLADVLAHRPEATPASR